MENTLSPREAMQVIAALRFWQEESRHSNLADEGYEAYFEEHEPMESSEIDQLCKKVLDLMSS